MVRAKSASEINRCADTETVEVTVAAWLGEIAVGVTQPDRFPLNVSSRMQAKMVVAGHKPVSIFPIGGSCRFLSPFMNFAYRYPRKFGSRHDNRAIWLLVPAPFSQVRR